MSLNCELFVEEFQRQYMRVWWRASTSVVSFDWGTLLLSAVETGLFVSRVEVVMETDWVCDRDSEVWFVDWSWAFGGEFSFVVRWRCDGKENETESFGDFVSFKDVFVPGTCCKVSPVDTVSVKSIAVVVVASDGSDWIVCWDFVSDGEVSWVFDTVKEIGVESWVVVVVVVWTTDTEVGILSCKLDDSWGGDFPRRDVVADGCDTVVGTVVVVVDVETKTEEGEEGEDDDVWSFWDWVLELGDVALTTGEPTGVFISTLRGENCVVSCPMFGFDVGTVSERDCDCDCEFDSKDFSLLEGIEISFPLFDGCVIGRLLRA